MSTQVAVRLRARITWRRTWEGGKGEEALIKAVWGLLAMHFKHNLVRDMRGGVMRRSECHTVQKPGYTTPGTP